MNDENTVQTRITREQKMGFIFLLIFALFTIGLGFLQLRNTIYMPFALRVSSQTPAVDLGEETQLQQIDTDHDGLNNYEELYFYETSPYLPDTDSDGILDKEEIDKGTDPLCVSGQMCNSGDELLIATSTPLLTSPAQTGLNNFDALLNTQTDGAITFDQAQALVNDPAKIRELLRRQGLSSEDIAAISDAELLEMARQSLNQIVQ